MAKASDQDSPSRFLIEEIPERLDEQHFFTTKIFGFLVHPNISLPSSPNLKVAEIGTGTGIWLLDVAKTLPSTCQLIGYDLSSSAFPPSETLPSNVSFTTQDMYFPFPEGELGTYDLVAVRFISSAASRADWSRAVVNLMTLLKPGGWLQWIDSCNFALYNSVAGTPRVACQEIYDGLQPLRAENDLVIGLMMRCRDNPRREDILRGLGLVDVHEDVFSTDRVQEPDLQIRDKGTRNIIACFLGCLEGLIGVEGNTWSQDRIARLRKQAMIEIDDGVYHTLDQVCIVGRKPA